MKLTTLAIVITLLTAATIRLHRPVDVTGVTVIAQGAPPPCPQRRGRC